MIRYRLKALSVALLLSSASLSAATPEPTLSRTASPAERAFPPLPSPEDVPFQLVIDDDMAEGAVGFSGSSARQFLWMNRFTLDEAITLDEIWVLFAGGSDVPLGGAVEILVYVDNDADPSNGASLLLSFEDIIQAADGETFSIYPVSPLTAGPGELLIGVVNRFFQAGVDPPPTEPAAIDTSSNAMRSYLGLWPGDPPAMPDLATATDIVLLDGFVGGNLMIRGFGSDPPVTAVPTQSLWGQLTFAALLALLAIAVSRRFFAQ